MVATIVANMLGDRNLASAIMFAVCNAAEAVIVAAVVERFSGPSNPLVRLRRVLGLLVAVLLGTAASGVGGTLGYIWFHKSAAAALTTWHHWFASDAIGIIAVAPLVIGLVFAVRDPPSRRELAEGAAALTVLVFLCALSIFQANLEWARELTVASLNPHLQWI